MEQKSVQLKVAHSSLLAEARIPHRAAARAHFLVINKVAGQFYLSFDTRYNPNTFFLNWKQRTAGKAVDEDALQYIKMFVARV